MYKRLPMGFKEKPTSPALTAVTEDLVWSVNRTINRLVSYLREPIPDKPKGPAKP